MVTHFLNIALVQVSGVAVNPDNPVVSALIGHGGMVRIAWAVFQGALMLRSLELGYCWMVKGDAAYLRSCIMTCAGGLALSYAPALIGAITGVAFPTLF